MCTHARMCVRARGVSVRVCVCVCKNHSRLACEKRSFLELRKYVSFRTTVTAIMDSLQFVLTFTLHIEPSYKNSTFFSPGIEELVRLY